MSQELRRMAERPRGRWKPPKSTEVGKPEVYLGTHSGCVEQSHQQYERGGTSAGKASWSQVKEILRGQEKEVELYPEDNIETKNVTSGVHFRNINLAD